MYGEREVTSIIANTTWTRELCCIGVEITKLGPALGSLLRAR